MNDNNPCQSHPHEIYVRFALAPNQTFDIKTITIHGRTAVAVGMHEMPNKWMPYLIIQMTPEQASELHAQLGKFFDKESKPLIAGIEER